MLLMHIAAQQDARATTTAGQSTAGAPGQTDRAGGALATGLNQAEQELRDQIRATIQSAQDASRDAQRTVRIQQGQVNVPAIPAIPPFPGQTVQRPVFGDNFIPDQAVSIANGFFVMCAVMVVGWPLARAFGRRMERGTQSAALPPGMTEQLQRIEQAVDAMAIEVERISESQRFLAKLQSAQSAEPVALPGAERR